MTELRSADRVPRFPLGILLFVIAIALVGPWIVPFDPQDGNLVDQFMPPIWINGGSMLHPFGTDQMGRDVLSRLIAGARISMIVGFTAVIFSGCVGTVIAITAGYLGGAVDAILMRLTDAMMSMPYLLIGVALAGILGPGLMNLVVVLAVMGWASYARIIRAEVLKVKTLDYVVIARITDCSLARILWRHIFPNILIKCDCVWGHGFHADCVVTFDDNCSICAAAVLIMARSRALIMVGHRIAMLLNCNQD
jgi:peptide/nickel transport system permease protein